MVKGCSGCKRWRRKSNSICLSVWNGWLNYNFFSHDAIIVLMHVKVFHYMWSILELIWVSSIFTWKLLSCQGAVNRKWVRRLYFSVDLRGFSPWHPPKSLNITVKPLFRCTWMQFLTHVRNTPSQLFLSRREQEDELSQLTLTAYFKFNLKDSHHTHKSINNILD